MAMAMPNAGSDLSVTTSDKPPKTLKKEKRVEKGTEERREWEAMKVLKHVYIEEGKEGTKSLRIGRAQLMKFILLFVWFILKIISLWEGHKNS